MATYAIGDVQGCFSELEALLREIDFDPCTDLLWFVGDLVNRGPQSLEVLRFIKHLGDAARVVLGNHDLHLLATSQGVRKFKSRDTFQDVLNARDRAVLLDWLREQPLLHHDASLEFTMVHAGLAPQWNLKLAQRLSQEISTVLQGRKWIRYFEHMYGDTPVLWKSRLSGWKRTRFITNAFTRMRYCRADGSLALEIAETPAPKHLGVVPWFAMPARKSEGTRIVFGHWATLQLNEPLSPKHDVHHVDLGCVWGGSLAALRLEDLHRFAVPAGV